MTFINRILQTSDKSWDIAGVIFGAIGSLAILGQLINELQLTTKSSLSLSFLLGYVAVFAFWLLYGLRFKRPAIIITNGVCLLLQSALLGVVLY
jgi:uncharacterized protein with PQ loop repeat